MSARYLLAYFDHEGDLLQATAAVRRQGWKIVDAFTPYAVHGLDEALGVRPSRLTGVCFRSGMAGAVGRRVLGCGRSRGHVGHGRVRRRHCPGHQQGGEGTGKKARKRQATERHAKRLGHHGSSGRSRAPA